MQDIIHIRTSVPGNGQWPIFSKKQTQNAGQTASLARRNGWPFGSRSSFRPETPSIPSLCLSRWVTPAGRVYHRNSFCTLHSHLLKSAAFKCFRKIVSIISAQASCSAGLNTAWGITSPGNMSYLYFTAMFSCGRICVMPKRSGENKIFFLLQGGFTTCKEKTLICSYHNRLTRFITQFNKTS